MQQETETKPDIFDKMMSSKLLSPFEPFYKAHKEILLYLFFGGCTTLVAIITFWLPDMFIDLPNRTIAGIEVDVTSVICNLISWVCGVVFAYVTNRTWVFSVKAHGARGIVIECAEFTAGRLFTLIVETILINVCTTTINMNGLLAKAICTVVTVILNYVISKLLVFREKK